MVTVTETAKQQLKAVLSANTEEGDVGLRLIASGPGQFGLTLDEEKEGDQVVEHEGSKVLLIAEELSGAFEGVTIDSQETPEGRRLVISKK